MIAKSLLLFWTVLCLAGCVINTSPTGPLQYDSFHLDRDRSELVKVNLNMGAGKLQVAAVRKNCCRPTSATTYRPGSRP